MRKVVSLLLATLAILACGSSSVTGVMYSVTTHYEDKDTSCGSTPYRIDVDETVNECSESGCAASANGLYDGVAEATCTRDYKNEVWTRFGSAVYILQVINMDSECTNFAYARAYLADGECHVGSTSAWYTAKIEANGSVTLQYFTSDSCSPDDLFMSTDRATKDDLDSGACDASSSQWFTNQGNTAAPLVGATTASSSDSGSTNTEATSDSTTTTADTTDTYDSTANPSTSTTDSTNTSSSGDGDAGLGIGGILGIVCGCLVAIATVYAIVFHRDRPISITCFSASVV